MADTICDIRYPGLKTTTGEATCTLSHGVDPSQFRIETAINPTFVPKVGDVEVIQNGRVVVRFKDCAINQVYMASGDEIRFTVIILDRRWKWVKGGGHISAKYNTRKPDGKIDKETEKSPRDIAKELFKKLGDSKADVSVIPSKISPDTAPEIDWDHERTHVALGDFLRKVGCRVVLKTDDSIEVVKIGKGRKKLPTIGLQQAPQDLVENVAIPDEIEFVAGRTTIQGLLELEAVAEDLDGKIKLVDDVSYKPEDEDWEDYSPQFPERAVTFGKDEEEQEKARNLARQCVWRWFRVKGQPGGKLGPVPGMKVKVDKLKQYVLQTKLLDTKKNENDTIVHLPAHVVGDHYDDEIDSQQETDGQKLDRSFSIDTDNYIVKFSEPVYRINDDDDTEDYYRFPRLWLMTTYHISDPEEKQPVRFTKKKRLGKGKKAGTGTFAFKVDDVYRTVRITHEKDGDEYKEKGSPEVNDEDLNKAADYYLEARSSELQPDPGKDASYAGFLKLDPDGNTPQVTWSLSNGTGTTRASLGVEHSVLIPRFELRRRVLKLDQIVEEES